MSGVARLRVLGVGWAVVVSVVLMLVEPALQQGIFVAGMAMLAAGWLMLAGLAGHATAQTSAGNCRRPDLDTQLLSETGDVLLGCSRAFGQQFDETRAELVRAGQISTEAIASLIDSFQAMTDQSKRQQELGLLLIQQNDGASAPPTPDALRSVVDGVVGNAKVATEDVERINRSTRQTVSELQQIAAAMEHNVGQAVMSLQFQDMLMQLIAHVTRRLDALPAQTNNNPVRQGGFTGGAVELF